MPAAARLPFMMAELAVFASVSGLFSKKILQNAWMAFPAVLLAQVGGRASFLLLVAVFQNIAPFTVGAGLVADSGGAFGNAVTGGCRPVSRNGFEISFGQGQKE